MKLSKTLIDTAGKSLSRDTETDVDKYILHTDAFDEYRKNHLEPLSKTTIELQQWLAQFGKEYFIAQRLKRKPQILRKLRRFSARLSQLQDIGGTRVIVEQNKDVDELVNFLKERFETRTDLKLVKLTDYRGDGREDSGYRAYHLILEREGYRMELQIRSKIQHYWAETIERTSVIYGYHLKELEGDPSVIHYFKRLSDLFYEIEAGRTPSAQLKTKIEELRIRSEEIIQAADEKNVFSSFVNEGVTKDLERKENSSGSSGLNYWIFVFNWNIGSFVVWDLITNDPDGAIRKYVEYENKYTSDNGFEVVLVGSSKVSTLRQTHSHYFGLNHADGPILEDLNSSIVGFSNAMDIDVGAREILRTLERRHFWGTKVVSLDTLKNHFCKGVITFDSSLQALTEKRLVLNSGYGISLNIKMKGVINKYVS
ncbi:RelA/SpoT domain-containing protein [Dyadobacter aurulentus]|uniref:RelA/SpoT domain-containing protein n=1 Tax=Dyadobacter sp. UC 10 TaxID=2605428 RepID=UPI0011F34F47|nr:RelA/SpoT domain-containing protein [Dyadobacter sp. UC 10]KAA0989272.1 RelA/SpoT domain-containing protein [Dyadobacter sp. UC 10]